MSELDEVSRVLGRLEEGLRAAHDVTERLVGKVDRMADEQRAGHHELNNRLQEVASRVEQVEATAPQFATFERRVSSLEKGRVAATARVRLLAVLWSGALAVGGVVIGLFHGGISK